MPHYKLHIILGTILIIVPYLGIPLSYKHAILYICGAILILLGFTYRIIVKAKKETPKTPKPQNPYSRDR